MMARLSNHEAIVIVYFRDIAETFGVPIAVFVRRIQFEVFIREDWQPVLAYDKDADIELLRSFVEDLHRLEEDSVELTRLLRAENSIRAEKMVFTDPGFDQKLTDLLRGLSKRS